MQNVKNCAYCGKPFLIRKHRYAQKYCCRDCGMQAQRERDRKVKAEAREQIRQGNALSSVNRPRPYCSDLWKQYRECKRRMMIAEQAKIERLLREKGCWFRGRLHVTNKQRENAEKRDSEIA